MARLFAENEIRVVDEWSKREVASKGFIEPDAKTGEAFLSAIGNQPVTFEWLDKVAQAMVKAGWVLYAVPISKEEAEYNRIFDALSQGEKDAFGAWWGRQGTAVDKSAKAATLLINWCAGRGVTQANLDLAMGNLASRGLLTVRQPSNYRGGIHSGKDLRDEVPLSSAPTLWEIVCILLENLHQRQKPGLKRSPRTLKGIQVRRQMKCGKKNGKIYKATIIPKLRKSVPS